MHQNIEKLYRIATKSTKHVIGLMSGTSLDGLDIAYCVITGSGLQTQLSVQAFATIPYDANFREAVKKVFSKDHVSLQQLTLLHSWIATQHAAMVCQFLADHHIDPNAVDLIASHGQTVYHAPKRLHQLPHFDNATLQIGDGDHLAVKTGIITLSDFRQKHIAAGAEGAPLATYGDYLLFSHPTENRLMLNIGGIANFTFLPAGQTTTGIFSTDTGPGNTLMDAYMQQYFAPATYDAHAHIASKGMVHKPLLDALLQHPYFGQAFPKTTGPEMFHLSFVQSAMAIANASSAKHEDILATLNYYTAKTIAIAIEQTIAATPLYVYVSGGGVHNPLLMHHLQTLLPQASLRNFSSLGIDADAKEAALFAVLANEAIADKPTDFGDHPNMPSIGMGKISFPN